MSLATGERSSRIEQSRRGGDDLVLRHVPQMLADVPVVPERILELAVPVTPEHVGQRLAYLRPGPDRPGEHRVSGASTPISGNSSARCSKPSAIRSWTDISRPSGTGIRLTSSAPNASA
jgi:hypothetical protein